MNIAAFRRPSGASTAIDGWLVVIFLVFVGATVFGAVQGYDAAISSPAGAYARGFRAGQATAPPESLDCKIEDVMDAGYLVVPAPWWVETPREFAEGRVPSNQPTEERPR